MKKCRSCQQRKPPEDFTWKDRHRLYRQSQCKRCRSNQIKAKQQANKIALVNALGGRCRSCGYNRCLAALEFHHQGGKEFELHSQTRELSILLEEARKCVLLCANCHREIHHCPEEA